MPKNIVAVDNENLVAKCAHVEHVETQLNFYIMGVVVKCNKIHCIALYYKGSKVPVKPLFLII